MTTLKRFSISVFLFGLLILVSSCTVQVGNEKDAPILAVESFLGDLTRRIAGDALVVDTLISPGIDLHGFQPSPQDIARIAKAKVIIANGAGLESWLQPILNKTSTSLTIIEASAGIPLVDDDPHLWLDPILVKNYVDNIEQALSDFEPTQSTLFSNNAEELKQDLDLLDAWIRQQVEQIPLKRRLLITNHESLGYFARRYGFTLLGSIIPSHDALAETTAQHITELISQIKLTSAPAIFLETGSNPKLAEQLEAETGVKVISGLYTHSTDDQALTYIEMMRANVNKIVDALR